MKQLLKQATEAVRQGWAVTCRTAAAVWKPCRDGLRVYQRGGRHTGVTLGRKTSRGVALAVAKTASYLTSVGIWATVCFIALLAKGMIPATLPMVATITASAVLATAGKIFCKAMIRGARDVSPLHHGKAAKARAKKAKTANNVAPARAVLPHSSLMASFPATAQPSAPAADADTGPTVIAKPFSRVIYIPKR